MFHLASALQNTPSVKPGDNIILSRWGNVLILKINLHLFVQNPAENYNTIVGRVKRIAMMLNDWQPLHSFLKWPLGFLISSTSFSHFDHFIDWLSTNCWISKKKIKKLYFGRLYKKNNYFQRQNSILARIFGLWCRIGDFYRKLCLTHITRRACHDANIAPWLLLANRLRLEASSEDPISQVTIFSRCAGWRWRVGQMIPPVTSCSSGRTLWTPGQGSFPFWSRQ